MFFRDIEFSSMEISYFLGFLVLEQVIFRDFNASNVLLDEKFQPKLSDFGLAREGPSDGRSHVSTAVLGKQGYAAPEYIEIGRLTRKSDIWDFGVVLFEILTGRRALDRKKPKDEQRLLDWVKKFPPQSSRFSSAMDPRLEKRYSLAAARMVADLANSCLLKNPEDRPAMGEVVERLQRAIEATREEPGEAAKIQEKASPENIGNGGEVCGAAALSPCEAGGDCKYGEQEVHGVAPPVGFVSSPCRDGRTGCDGSNWAGSADPPHYPTRPPSQT